MRVLLVGPVFCLALSACIQAPEKLAPPPPGPADGSASTDTADTIEPDDDGTTDPTDALPPEDTEPAEDPGMQTDATEPPDDDGTDSDDGTDATDLPDACTPDCDAKDCGADGCGGLCGVCVFGEKCNNLQICAPECEASCDGKFCGPDGCEGSCGTCEEDFECGPDGKCYDVACVPECTDKVCGGDGCGGQCGECALGDLCVEGACVIGPCSGIPENGKCEDGAAYLCVDGAAQIDNCLATEGMICAWDPPLGHFGCVVAEECVPQCEGKDCGDDGCGSKCGVCPAAWPCEVGQCKLAVGGACGYITPVGTCEDDLLWYCSEELLFTQDCAAIGLTCGFDPIVGANQCVE